LDIPDKLLKAKTLLKDYKDYSKTSLVSYSIGVILLGLHFICKNNKLPEIAEASLSLSIIAFVFFIIYVVVDAFVYSKFQKAINQKAKKINPILLILSLPLYPLKYIFLRNKIAQDFYLCCLQNIK
jgi:lipopolysaccharide export system permease protein